MTAEGEDPEPERRECANCASVESLSLCSRCRSAFFCSHKCQRSYWPFHRAWCRQNDFADAVEASEPRFAAWMRRHGKLGVLKDDEVDRLERKVVAMEDMYGRANPKPAPPSYDADDARAMRAAAEGRLALQASTPAAELAWAAVEVAPGLGLDCGAFKWRQTQSWVEVFVRLPPGTRASDLAVVLSPTRLAVELRGGGARPLLPSPASGGGALYAPVKAEESLWLIADAGGAGGGGAVLEARLLKRSRRGAYADGATNADTYWWSLFALPPQQQPAGGGGGGGGGGPAAAAAGRLPGGPYPPAAYYATEWERPEGARRPRGRGGARRALAAAPA